MHYKTIVDACSPQSSAGQVLVLPEDHTMKFIDRQCVTANYVHVQEL